MVPCSQLGIDGEPAGPVKTSSLPAVVARTGWSGTYHAPGWV